MHINCVCEREKTRAHIANNYIAIKKLPFALNFTRDKKRRITFMYILWLKITFKHRSPELVHSRMCKVSDGHKTSPGSDEFSVCVLWKVGDIIYKNYTDDKYIKNW